MTISKVEYGEQEIAKPSNRKISAILLLGGFQVFDKQGNNITGEFTPTLKLLFLFLSAYSSFLAALIIAWMAMAVDSLYEIVLFIFSFF